MTFEIHERLFYFMSLTFLHPSARESKMSGTGATVIGLFGLSLCTKSTVMQIAIYEKVSSFITLFH